MYGLMEFAADHLKIWASCDQYSIAPIASGLTLRGAISLVWR